MVSDEGKADRRQREAEPPPEPDAPPETEPPEKEHVLPGVGQGRGCELEEQWLRLAPVAGDGGQGQRQAAWGKRGRAAMQPRDRLGQAPEQRQPLLGWCLGQPLCGEGRELNARDFCRQERVLEGDDPGRITWAPGVEEEAARLGRTRDAEGYLTP